jgi:hypothetical protein
MDLLLEMLEDPVHRHVLLNHLPIVGLGMAWVFLVWALVDRRWSSMVFGLSVVAALSASTLLVTSAGDAAYPVIFDELDGPGREWLDYHTYLGDRWGWVIAANGLLALLAIATGHFREPLRRGVASVVVVTTLVALVLGVFVAEAGGKIRHPEFRLGPPPAYEAPGRLR